VTFTTALTPAEPTLRSTFRLIYKPASSTASLMTNPDGRTATLVPDASGEYLVESYALTADGKEVGYPGYFAIVASPLSLSAAIEINPTPNEKDSIFDKPDQPPAPANTTRIYVDGAVSAAYETPVRVVAREAFLDGKSLGVLREPNIQVPFVTSVGEGYRPAYAYDVGSSSFADSAHTLTVLYTTNDGDVLPFTVQFTGAPRKHVQEFLRIDK